MLTSSLFCHEIDDFRYESILSALILYIAFIFFLLFSILFAMCRVGRYRLYHGSVTRYFYSTVIGAVDAFKKGIVFGTVVTFWTVLLDISVIFF